MENNFIYAMHGWEPINIYFNYNIDISICTKKLIFVHTIGINSWCCALFLCSATTVKELGRNIKKIPRCVSNTEN